jgi:hypothetical protein
VGGAQLFPQVGDSIIILGIARARTSLKPALVWCCRRSIGVRLVKKYREIEDSLQNYQRGRLGASFCTDWLKYSDHNGQAKPTCCSMPLQCKGIVAGMVVQSSKATATKAAAATTTTTASTVTHSTLWLFDCSLT